MPPKAQIKGRVSLDGKPAETTLTRLKQRGQTFSRQMSGLKIGLGAGFAAGITPALLNLAKGAAIAAAEVEDLQVQFGVLLGDTDRAAAHMEELKRFAAKTPFQLGDIANASQQLLNLTEGALGGTESLKLFGDVAAATGNKDLPNVTYWIGRLYAALQTGRPIVDTANALMRLKIMAPSVAKEMMRMQQEGASGQAMWETFTGSLGKFEGGMERMSKTLSGLWSTLKDNWKLMWAEFGRAMAPALLMIMKGLTALFQMLNKVAKAVSTLLIPINLLMKGEAVNAENFRRQMELIWGKEGGAGILDKAQIEDAADKAKAALKTKLRDMMKAAREEMSALKKERGELAGTLGGYTTLRRIGAGGGPIQESTWATVADINRQILDVQRRQAEIQEQIKMNTKDSGLKAV